VNELTFALRATNFALRLEMAASTIWSSEAGFGRGFGVGEVGHGVEVGRGVWEATEVTSRFSAGDGILGAC